MLRESLFDYHTIIRRFCFPLTGQENLTNDINWVGGERSHSLWYFCPSARRRFIYGPVILTLLLRSTAYVRPGLHSQCVSRGFHAYTEVS